MELETHSNPSYVYVTAPTSPNAYSKSSSMEFYYSAPASPQRKPTISDQKMSSNFDDFEFETSKKFSTKQTYRARGDSLPSMAFADELFFNGLVMPLKLPPRLQYNGDLSPKSPVLSPKSPRTVCKIPFATRKTSWNDDFDPFLVAMEKVREEKRGRNSLHRRSRSYSPFRAMPKCSNEYTNSSNQGLSNETCPIEPMQVLKPSHSGPLDLKGSAYARWVRDQTREAGSSQRGPKSPRGFLFGQRVRPVKTKQDGLGKSHSTTRDHVKEKNGNVKEESKVQKLKGLLLKYASFGRENGGIKQAKTSLEACKSSYFSRLRFKLNGKGQRNGNNKGDTKMEIVQYKPSVVLTNVK